MPCPGNPAPGYRCEKILREDLPGSRQGRLYTSGYIETAIDPTTSTKFNGPDDPGFLNPPPPDPYEGV